MDYAKAKAIVDQHAPDLSCEDGGRHVNLFKPAENGAKGTPFSVTLPTSTEAVPLTAEQEEELFLGAVTAAKANL